jgi:hypothetical protein
MGGGKYLSGVLKELVVPTATTFVTLRYEFGILLNRRLRFQTQIIPVAMAMNFRE